MKSGRDEITKITGDSANLIQQAIDTVSSMAKEQEITLEANSDSIAFQGDRDRLTQILTNLLSNAIKFSPNISKVAIAAKNCRDEGIRILSCGTRDTANGRNVRQPSGRKSTVVAVADEFGSPSYNL